MDESLMGFLVFLYIVIIAAMLYVGYIVAKQFEKIANQKGYGEEKHTLAMCFWLGIVGYLYVIALPDMNFEKRLQESISKPETEQQPKPEN